MWIVKHMATSKVRKTSLENHQNTLVLEEVRSSVGSERGGGEERIKNNTEKHDGGLGISGLTADKKNRFNMVDTERFGVTEEGGQTGH